MSRGKVSVVAEKYILTSDQQKLVEENLDLPDILLRTKIHPNETIRGMEFEELYQCGCLALCRAAATYDHSTQFRTYASRVVYNAMIDQCRTAQKHYGNTLSYDAVVGDDEDSYSIFLQASDAVDETVLAGELTKLLDEAKKTYKGAVLKGIEAIELQLKGYSGAEIARMYGVKNNNVTSWISKARAALGREYPGYCY